MRYGVFFKGVGPAGGRIVEALSWLEREPIRGLGEVFVYEAHRASVYFVPLREDFSFNAKRYEKAFISSVGPPKALISFGESEGVEIYPTGNITTTNPLLHPSFIPRSVSPTDPDLIGTLWLALGKAGIDADIVAVHDPPSNLEVPHIRVTFPVRLVDDIIVALLASVRRKKVFVPYVTVSDGYTARYFYPHFRGRYISAYHVPHYWAHFLDGNMFGQMARKGGPRRVLVKRGLVLPWELPKKEV